MNCLLTLYNSDIKRIYKRRRYKAYTTATVSLVIVCGIFLAVTGSSHRLLIYPYNVLTAVKYFFAPVAAAILAADIAPRKIDKCLAVSIMAILVYLLKMLLAVYMASSFLSVMICGIESISLAHVLAVYAVNFIYIAAGASIIALMAALIKRLLSKKKIKGWDLYEKEE